MRNIQTSPSGLVLSHDHNSSNSNNMAILQDIRSPASSSATTGAIGSSIGRKRRYYETKDVLKRMKHLEDTTYRQPLPSGSSSSSSDRGQGHGCDAEDAAGPVRRQLPSPFHGLWRQQIIEWMYTLVKYCKLRHEAAAAATYYLDQAVCRGLITTPSDYQLGAMTALYLALKVYDSPSMRIVKLSSLVKLGNGDFTEHDIVRMERDLVKILEWRLNPVTANCFLQQYLDVLDDCSSIHGLRLDLSTIEALALQSIEAAVARESFLSINRSAVAYAVLLSAVDHVAMSSSSSSSSKLIYHLMVSFRQRMIDVVGLDSAGPNVIYALSMLEHVTGYNKSNKKRTSSAEEDDEVGSSTSTRKVSTSDVEPISPVSPHELAHQKEHRPSATTKNPATTFTSNRISSSSLSTTLSRSSSVAESTTTPAPADTKMQDIGSEDPEVDHFMEAAISPNFVFMQ
mmetsp:Transcript_25761/g.61026  ORF Transcript_25761/g.61026 Transcript_25761/m.61026 type:complete len:455 (-) Transcript_25761:677-2041(-)